MPPRLLCRFVASSSGTSAHRIFTIYVPLDEQLVDAWNSAALCHSALGHLPGIISLYVIFIARQWIYQFCLSVRFSIDYCLLHPYCLSCGADVCLHVFCKKSLSSFNVTFGVYRYYSLVVWNEYIHMWCISQRCVCVCVCLCVCVHDNLKTIAAVWFLYGSCIDWRKISGEFACQGHRSMSRSIFTGFKKYTTSY